MPKSVAHDVRERDTDVFLTQTNEFATANTRRFLTAENAENAEEIGGRVAIFILDYVDEVCSPASLSI